MQYLHKTKNSVAMYIINELLSQTSELISNTKLQNQAKMDFLLNKPLKFFHL